MGMHTQTGTGNNNTQKPKLALDKSGNSLDDMLFTLTGFNRTYWLIEKVKTTSMEKGCTGVLVKI